MKNLFSLVTDLLYENACLICNESAKNLNVCYSCETSILKREENYLKHFNEILVFSWAYYEGKLRDGIINLKTGKKKLAKYFAEKLSDFWNNIQQDKNNCLVIPVPSHKKRIKERGYCQASLIGKYFSARQGFPFSDNLIAREKETSFMNSMTNLHQRKENIKNAFEVTEELTDINKIIIIDDILTSGSTMCEIARTIHSKYPNVNLTGLTVASGDTYN
ncbi:MAG: ComF family protein [Candidatus Melainabacteria bacterium]|nr:ComF family protein [Candidatus Melainabacteria bacterium]